MADRTTLTVRLSAEMKARLGVLAGLERGLADVGAGRLVDHDAAMDELDGAIERAARERA